MKSTKRVTLFLVTLLLLSFATIAGCSSAPAAKPEASTPAASTPASTPAAEPKVIQVGHVSTADIQDPYHRFASKFGEYVEKASNGSIKVEVISGGQFGQEREMFEGMQLGTVDAGIMTNSYASNFVKEVALFDLPFLFPNYDIANKVLDGSVGQKVFAAFQGSGVTPLAWGVGGFRQLVTNGSGVRTPEDMVGKKIRSMETKMYMNTYAALGVNAVPMAFSETIPGLQQKTIDGVDLPVSVLAANRFYDVADYISLTGHFYSPLIICISDSVWSKFTPEEQTLLKKAAVDAGNEEREFIVKNEADKLQILKDNGMTVIEDVDYDAFQNKLANFYEEQKSNISADLVDELMAALKEVK